MNKFLSVLFSMKLMLILIIVLASSLAVGTFIENNYNTLTAKSMIYSSSWIAVLMGLLCCSLLYNLFTRKLYRKSKISIGLFHVSFVFIIIGGAITRFVSYEGVVHIRENQYADKAVTDDPYVYMKVHDYKSQYIWKKQKYFSSYSGKWFSFLSNNNFSKKIDFKGNEVKIEYLDFISNARLPIGVNVSYINDSLFFIANKNILFEKMSTREKGVLASEEKHFFERRVLYDIDGIQFVLKEIEEKLDNNKVLHLVFGGEDGRQDYYLNSGTQYSPSIIRNGARQLISFGFENNIDLNLIKHIESDEEELDDLLKIKITANGESKKINLFGDIGAVSQETEIKLGDLNFSISYGSHYIDLPFYIKLNKFVSNKYPGSEEPSSFESYVEVIDKEKVDKIDNLYEEYRKNVFSGNTSSEIEKELFQETSNKIDSILKSESKPFHIYMNHILKHKGHRLYQSSYDADEKGTVLSMNHDLWGTLVTYLGYILLASGLISTLFNPKSRFRLINKGFKKQQKNI